MRERRYASTGDYGNYTGDRAPEDLDRRLLVRSSRRVDAALIGAVYAIDEHGMPTDEDIREALRDATCAQAQFSYARGDKTGTGVVTQWGSVKIGDVALANPNVGSGGGPVKGVAPGTVCDPAEDILRDAGLLPVEPWIFG
jgi:hypothetical protein